MFQGRCHYRSPDQRGLKLNAVFSGDVFKDWPVLIWDLQGYRFAENGLHVLSLEWAGFYFEGAMQKEKNQPDVICVTRKKKKVN